MILLLLLNAFYPVSKGERRLMLDGKGITPTKVEKMLKKNPEARELFLSNFSITGLPDAFFKQTHMNKLYLSNVRFTDQPDFLNRLCPTNSLQELSLNAMDLPIVDLAPKKSGPMKASDFCVLYMRRISIINSTTHTLYITPYNATIRSINLFNSKFSSLPDKIETFRKLEEINLGKNPITDYNQELKRLAGLKHLKKIGLEYSKLTKVPDALFQMVQLEELHLQGNALPAFDRRIAQMTQLKKLWLFDMETTWTETEKQQLQAWLPQCEIRYQR